ncbi:hypothetical protein HMPREF9294_1413 [Porphyromonas asaccharolytica PR426713P-I]|uniref:hypothetical protein n=1 Tax=Porphyromonas asaccharolytica TaxID=28123 RepID=UPI0001EB26E3|nr:hypothetical protein [Porphyromonas asaccharolytica]EFR33998.1 hypothetical protein HMPREF9294_1413 [Porphyromonas asaccharolytica PR426713P-I]
MHLKSRYLLIVLLAFICRSLVAQERAALEQLYQPILERPLGVAPAVSNSVWEQLLQKALDAPETTVTLQTKAQDSLEMRIDKARLRCTISVSGLLTYELLLAPWRTQGEQPLLQITTLEQPYRVSQLTAFLPKQEKQWVLDATIPYTDWLIHSKEKEPVLSPSESLLSQLAEMPLVLTFATEQGRRAVRICATPSLEGWTTKEETKRIKQLISTSPLSYQLTRRGILKRIK